MLYSESVILTNLFYGTAGYPSDRFDLTYYALDHRTGEIVWQNQDTSGLGLRADIQPNQLFRNNLEILDYMAPSLWKDTVIFTSGDTTVRAFSQGSGSLISPENG